MVDKRRDSINEKKIMAQHPDPKKKGVRISQEKYDIMRAAILEALHEHPQLKFQELAKIVEEKLSGRFDGSILWYMTAVKLDMEVKKEIERVPGTRPHLLRLVKS
ncbi:MAG: hypothetical protein HXY40_05205 [Chloroflexi bacterium]|nr:hypothetical protein [Chloroflexota bacterium]